MIPIIVIIMSVIRAVELVVDVVVRVIPAEIVPVLAAAPVAAVEARAADGCGILPDELREVVRVEREARAVKVVALALVAPAVDDGDCGVVGCGEGLARGRGLVVR